MARTLRSACGRAIRRAGPLPSLWNPEGLRVTRPEQRSRHDVAAMASMPYPVAPAPSLPRHHNPG